MRAVVQRVSRAKVTVDGRTVGRIGRGILVLLGIRKGDQPDDARTLARKVCNLRIFQDETGKMNHSALEVDAEVLVVSQFTLYGDCRKGRRPGFDRAAPPDLAEHLYRLFIGEVAALGLRTAQGQFAALMQVHLVNDGPVTLLLDTEKVL